MRKTPPSKRGGSSSVSVPASGSVGSISSAIDGEGIPLSRSLPAGSGGPPARSPEVWEHAAASTSASAIEVAAKRVMTPILPPPPSWLWNLYT